MTFQQKYGLKFTISCLKALGILSLATGNLTTKAYCQAPAFHEHPAELFITAGYGALFGAALGIALIPLIPSSSSSGIKYITTGASLGFLAGTGVGLYNLYQSRREYPIPESEFDNNYFYNSSNSSPNFPNKLQQTNQIKVANNKTAIQVGALFIKRKEQDLNIGIPCFLISPTSIQVNLAYFSF